MDAFLAGILAIKDTDALGFMVAAIALEAGVSWFTDRKKTGRHTYQLSDSLCSAAMALGYVTTTFLCAVPIIVSLVWLHQFAPFSIGVSDGAWAIVAVYLGVDFVFYWYHRIIHEVRLGWAAHVNHHSSEYLNYGTALRQSIFEPFMEPLSLVPLVLIGCDPFLVLACLSLNHLYQFIPHTEKVGKLGPLEWVLNTPSHHRVHHSSNIQYCDRNYAGTFMIWDQIFGTFEREDEPCRFGILKPIETRNPIKATFHEWAAIWRDVRGASSLREVAGYVFGPPGWAPDGKGETTKVMQARYRAEKAAAGLQQAAD